MDETSKAFFIFKSYPYGSSSFLQKQMNCPCFKGKLKLLLREKNNQGKEERNVLLYKIIFMRRAYSQWYAAPYTSFLHAYSHKFSGLPEPLISSAHLPPSRYLTQIMLYQIFCAYAQIPSVKTIFLATLIWVLISLLT